MSRSLSTDQTGCCGVPLSKIHSRLGSEVLQRSAVHDYPWPEKDPEEVLQLTRNWTEKDSDLLDQAVRNIRFSFDRFYESVRTLPIAGQLWALITSKAFNFNGVEGVRKEPFWVARIEAAVARAEPVEIAYPLICKVNNPAKRMSLVGCTAGERATIRFFRNLAESAKTIYQPGVRIRVLSDATLYNNALQIPLPSAYAYMNDFRALITEEQANTYIVFHDYTSLLSPVHRQFEEAYNRHYCDISKQGTGWKGWADWGSLPTSVRANVNTRRLMLDYPLLKKLLGQEQTEFIPLRLDVDTQAIHALCDQLAVKLACDELDLPNRIWPECIRATCHHGLKNDRYVLGLRVYPEYYLHSKLLPYHGMPLIEPDGRGTARLIIAPEVCLRSDDQLIRVLNECGEPVLYICSALGNR